MFKRMLFALLTAILVFVVSEVFNLTMVREMYAIGQDAMVAVSLQEAGAYPPWSPGRSRPVSPRPGIHAGDRKHGSHGLERGADRLAGKYGLNILNVTWEDTGRYQNSSVGPNISDVTIQVQHQDPNTRASTPDLDAGDPLPQFQRQDRRYLAGTGSTCWWATRMGVVQKK